nr:alpha-amylase [Lachnospiraceae bacterium]
YCGWFLNVNFYGNNEYNDGFSYDNWGGYNLLVKLNQKNPEVRDYICDVIRFWVREFDVDGIRLDAADVLDFDYMKALRAVANEVKPDFWLMGEVIHGDYTRWVNEGTLHSVTNYVLHKALFSGHNDHNYFEIAHTVKRLNDMSGNKGLKLYNFCDNHDVERIVNKLNNRADYLPVHILMYTLPGVPSIYYGSEFGIEGKKEKGSDASLRPELKYEDYKDALKKNDYTKIVAALGRIRQASDTLSYGDYKENSLTNRQYVYTRNTIDNTVIIAVNNDDNPAHVGCGGIRDGKYTGALSGSTITVTGGGFGAEIPAHSGEIWLPEDEYKVYSKGKKAAPVVAVKKAEPVKEPETVKKEESEAVKKAEPEKKAETVKAEETKKEDRKTDAVKTADKKPAGKAADKKPGKKTVTNGAGAKYGLEKKYDAIDPEQIKNRNDYDAMSIEELQVAILEKMASNGPVNDQMIKTVMDNVYPDSLKNWVKSFR